MAKELSCSDTTNKRYRDDINTDSPKIRNNKKKNPHSFLQSSTNEKGGSTNKNENGKNN